MGRIYTQVDKGELALLSCLLMLLVLDVCIVRLEFTDQCYDLRSQSKSRRKKCDPSGGSTRLSLLS